MDKQNIVNINGRSYDAQTGMPVQAKKTSPSASKRPVRSTGTLHKPLQRSQTLNRRLAKKTSPSASKRPSVGRTMDIAKSSRIARFAAHPVTEHPKATPTSTDKPATSHPMVSRITKRQSSAHSSSKASTGSMSAKQIKDQTVAAALEKATPNQHRQVGFFRRHSRKVTIAIVIVAIFAAGAYLTATNLPVLSVTFAASQAGIKATYPRYVPDGYHLQQPVTYRDGSVELEFVSNTGAGKYVIKQSRSSWDSSAVLTNVVQKAVGDDYIVTQDSGLTIYTYRGNAAWVNGGILYVIENSAPLADQIRSIATSL